jgi:hypothetical protein
MSVEMKEDAGGRILELKLSGKLNKADYDEFVPEVEWAVNEHGKIRMLVRMTDFHGWTAGALWEDIKFDLRHFADIELLALVGESKWQAGMAVFCKPFTKARIRYFDTSRLDEAERWIHAGLEQTVGTASD